MKKGIRIFTAWAIHTRSDEGHRFIGRYWPPRWNDDIGCRVKLWNTRAEARKVLREYVKKPGEYQPFPKATVVKVQVTVVEIGR